MDFLTQQEVSGFRQDIKHGDAKQIAEKTEFEKKLLDGLGADMENTLEHPERQKSVKFAKKINKRKRLAIWKENLKKIFGKL
jgi:hypothetical protein